MKGIVEVEFIRVGNVNFEMVENDVNVQKEFKKNWEKINVLMRKMLEEFYSKYKIRIRITDRIDVTPPRN